MTEKDKIKDQFVVKGYVELAKYKLPSSLLWQPDFVLSKSHYIYYIQTRSNTSVTPSLLNRIANIPKGNIIPLIVFNQALSNANEKYILSLGIGIIYFKRGKLGEPIIKHKPSFAIVRKEIGKKLETIDIFISSKQGINERKFIENRIEYLRKSNSYPFNPPHLIEYDKFNIPALYKHIDDTMNHCEWIIMVLEDQYSKVTYYEFKKAIKTLNHNNIFIFVKETKECKTRWKKALDKIKVSTKIKYLPYSDQNDLEVYLTRAVQKRMRDICKKKNIEIFV